MRGLEGKAAIVTGAAQGIGRAIADRLSDEGVKVLWADIDEQKVQESQKASGKGSFIKVTASFCHRLPPVCIARQDWSALRSQACLVAPQMFKVPAGGYLTGS